MNISLISEKPVPASSSAGARLADGLVALLACGFAALPLLDRVDALSVAAPLGVATIAVAMLWRRAAQRRRDAQQPRPGHRLQRSDRSDDTAELLARVLPVWNQQLESVKVQSTQAINSIVVDFASITGQFEAAGFKGAGGAAQPGADEDITLLARCERELDPVIDTMNRMLEGKDAMGGQHQRARQSHERIAVAGGRQSVRSRPRRTSSPSTPPSRPRAPVNRGAASR